jgi:hypothetical protein
MRPLTFVRIWWKVRSWVQHPPHASVSNQSNAHMRAHTHKYLLNVLSCQGYFGYFPVFLE